MEVPHTCIGVEVLSALVSAVCVLLTRYVETVRRSQVISLVALLHLDFRSIFGSIELDSTDSTRFVLAEHPHNNAVKVWKGCVGQSLQPLPCSLPALLFGEERAACWAESLEMWAAKNFGVYPAA